MSTTSTIPARRWAKLGEAAAYIKTDRSTLRLWIAQGRVRAYKIGPSSTRVDLNELDALAEPIPTVDGAA